MRCTTCHAENGAKSKFCRQCGAVMTPRSEPVEREAVKRCNECKIVAAAGALFCTACGGALMMAGRDTGIVAAVPRGGWRKPVTYVVMGLACVGVAGIYLHLMGGGRILPTTAEILPALPAAENKPAVLKTHGPGGRPWLSALRTDLRKCEAESIFTQPFCREKAKFKHCDPDRWGTVTECPKISLDDNG